MTEPNVEHKGEAPLRQEEENLPVLKVMMVGLVSMIVFALAVIVTAWGLGHVQQTQWPEGPAKVVPGQVERLERGIVDQELFVLTRRADQLKAEQRARLRSYGWVSRPHGIIHIPIEEAMRRVASGSPGPAPTPPGVTP